MTRILVTTDGSDLGHLALDHARTLAGALHAELVALYVQTDPALALAGEFAYVPPADPGAMKAEADAMCADLGARCPGVRVRVEDAHGLGVPQVILRAVTAEHADLVVMSTHGRSGLGRLLLGSVAEGVLHASPVPVLLVRAGQVPAPWDAAPAPDGRPVGAGVA